MGQGRADTRLDQQFPSSALGDDAPVRQGDVIAGRYRVEGVIGVGGMGIVVSGYHLDLEQRVAIKLILPSAMNDVGLRERFLREARAAARLRSEHVTKVLDVGQLPSGAPYMVMELLEGCDLAALLAKHGPLPPEIASDFIAQACEAVAEAHALGIVHRDIKPQNLFLTTCVGGDALVKVLDFGVSKTWVAGAENLTKSMTVMGSPLYMSPEQMRSARDVDPRTDIWALGVVLFELLTGRVPFDGESIPALCLQVAGDAPAPSVAASRPDLPAGLAAIVARCLEKRPDDRYRDVGELAAALSRFVTPASSVTIARTMLVMSGMRRAGGTTSDAPVAVSSTQRPARRASAPTLAVAFLACAALVGAAGWRLGAARSPRPVAASAAPLLATPTATMEAPRAAEPKAVPQPEAPSPVVTVATASPTAKPRPQKRTFAPPPPAASSKYDDIPSIRADARPGPTPPSKDDDIPGLR